MAGNDENQGPPEQEQRTPTPSDEFDERRQTNGLPSVLEENTEPPRGVIYSSKGRELARVPSNWPSDRPEKSDNVCSLCAYLFQNWEHLQGQMTENERDPLTPVRLRRTYIHTSYVDLEASAKAGCMLCILSRRTVSDLVGSELEETPDLRGILWIQSIIADRFMDRYLQVYSQTQREEDLKSILKGIRTDFVLVEAFESPARGEDTGREQDAAQVSDASLERPRFESTNNLATWAKIESWLRVCTEEHTHCDLRLLNTRTSGPGTPLTSDHDWRPTRLLDCASAEGVIRMLITATDRASGDYITLSHRWPESMPSDKVLTTASFEVFRSGIATERLPCAVRDAILIAKRLSIRYLWVDAFCIIQDQKSDWEQESALMHKVYSNSHLNISALAARDTFDTLFRQRDVKLAKPAWIDLAVDSKMKRFYVNHQQHWQRVDRNHLNLRAWVLQERLLAPRVVHFGEDEVFWECQEMTACESQPSDDKHEGWRKRLATGTTGTTGQLRLPEDQRAIYSAWADVVKAYSRCKMSKAQDKLVAMSGLAQMFDSCGLHDEYIAGMWRRNLQAEMFWRCSDSDVMTQRRSAGYHAPSFSWASMTCPVLPVSGHGFDGTPEYLFDIIDVVVKHLTADKMGAISDAQLTLDCRLQKLRLYGHAGALEMSLVTQDLEVKEIPGDSRFPLSLSLDEALEVWDPRGANDLYYFPAVLEEHEWNDEAHVQHFLLRLVDIETATYSRIGQSNQYDVKLQEQLCLRSSPNAAQATYPCISYQDGKHRIRLV